MTSNNLYTTTWRCSCNHDNSLAHKKCKICGATIPASVFEQVYQEEIHHQNVEHAEEEKKRKIFLIVIAGALFFFAPLLFRLFVWVFELILFLVGTLAGMLCIVNECKKIKGISDNKAYGNGVIFVVSIMCYFVLVFVMGAWMNASRIMLGIISVCWMVFGVIHSIRVIKRKFNLSMPLDIMWCCMRLLPLVLIFVKTIKPE